MKSMMRILLVGMVAVTLAGMCACSQQSAPKQDQPQAQQTQQQDQQQDTQPVEVVIPLNAPEFTDQCTALPVRVVGNDTSGKQVDEVCYVDAQGKGIKLLPGDYSFAVIASPLVPEGHLFAIPEPGIGITLPAEAEQSGTYDVASDLAWAFGYLDASQVTKEKVEEAYEYALKSPGQEQLAETLYAGYESVMQ